MPADPIVLPPRWLHRPLLRGAMPVQCSPDCFNSSTERFAKGRSVAVAFVPCDDVEPSEPTVLRDLEIEHAEGIGIGRPDHVEDLHAEVE